MAATGSAPEVRNVPGVVARLVIAIGIVAGVVVFNRNILTIRLVEIDSLIRTAADEQQTDASDLLLRYQLLIDRFERKNDELETLRAEAMLAVIDGSRDSADRVYEEVRAERSLELHVLNGLRALLGKPPLVLRPDRSAIDTIAHAYMLERARRWPEAVAAYRTTLTVPSLDETERATLQLHLAFSLSMEGKREEARDVLAEVERQFPEHEHALVARDMIVYLDRIEEYRGPGASEVPGRAEFFRLEYAGAIDRLDRFIATRPPIEEEAEARYYRARALEETGQFNEAIREYERIAFLPSSQWTRESGRRLVVIGELYRPDEETSASGREILLAFDDEEFLAVAQRYNDAVGDFTLLPEPILVHAEDRGERTPAYGELWIRTDPAGARVVIGEDRYRSPVVLTDLEERAYEVVVDAEGFTPQTVPIAVEAGERRVLEVVLVPVEEQATELAVRSETTENPGPLGMRGVDAAGAGEMDTSPFTTLNAVQPVERPPVDVVQEPAPVGERTGDRSAVASSGTEEQRTSATAADDRPGEGGGSIASETGLDTGGEVENRGASTSDPDDGAVSHIETEPGAGAGGFDLAEQDSGERQDGASSVPDRESGGPRQASRPSPPREEIGSPESGDALAADPLEDRAIVGEESSLGEAAGFEEQVPSGGERALREENPPREEEALDPEHYAFLGLVTGTEEDGTIFVDMRANQPRESAGNLVVVRSEDDEYRPLAHARRIAVVHHTMIARLVHRRNILLIAVGDAVFVDR